MQSELKGSGGCMEFILVGIGGALGSIVRFKLGKILSDRFPNSFPIGTFVINISGALLLGVVSSMGAGKNMYLLLGDGFLGAYTTFSTFMYEGFHLFEKNEKKNAITYILASLCIGFIGYFLGFKLGKIARLI